MTTTIIKERYGKELERIKKHNGWTDYELQIYIEGYAAGTECFLEAIKGECYETD